MMKKTDVNRIALMLGTLALALGFFTAGAVAAGPGNVTGGAPVPGAGAMPDHG